MKILEYRGGLGDLLMLTCVAHEWAKRDEEVGIVTYNQEIYENNPDIKWVCFRESRYHRYFHRLKNRDEGIIHPNYLFNFNKAEDTRDPLTEHVLKYMCRASDITGEIELRPWFFPKWISSDLERVRIIEKGGICFHSSGIGAQSYSPNKEWIVDRMREVVKRVGREYVTVQIGTDGDPELGCAMNLAGKLTLNELGVVFSRTRLFVGLEGMPMHMARAVGCPSVIIYGGRLKPWQIGYAGNYAITTECVDSRYAINGCWRQKKCDYINSQKERDCMDKIKVEDVIKGIETMLTKPREMEVEKTII